MKPFFNATCDTCNRCHKAPCACPEAIFGIDRVADKPATYRFNTNGKTVVWDFKPGIYDAQTDTSLVADVVARLLRFTAERHTDTITAAELGAILHLNDLGDVSTKGAQDGSMMVYRSSDICGEGCVGTNNRWEAWNALDEQASSAAYATGFNADGRPVTLSQPTNPNQYYNLGWNGKNQLSYAQPAVESAVIPDSEGYAYQMYIHPTTKQPYYVRVKV